MLIVMCGGTVTIIHGFKSLSFCEFVKSKNQQFDIVHVVDAERLSDRIDLDGELLFHWLAFALSLSFVVNEEGALGDQELEDILNTVDADFVVHVIVAGVCTPASHGSGHY